MPVRCNRKVTYAQSRISFFFLVLLLLLLFLWFVCLFVLFCGGEGWFGSSSEKRRNEKLNLFVVFRLFTVCNTRRFAQTFRRARYATGMYSSMQSYCEWLENDSSTSGRRRGGSWQCWCESYKSKRKKLSRAFGMDKVSRNPTSYHRKSVQCPKSCRLHRSD